MRASLLAIALFAGCWTGSSQPAEQPSNGTPAAETEPPLRFGVKLERTPCMGDCPVYSVVIRGDGTVEWNGIDNVAVQGHRVSRRVARADLQKLVRQVERARFFERNDEGELPAGPVCTTISGTTTCSYSMHVCSDTSHSKLTITSAGHKHTIDNDHCDAKPGIDEIEAEVDGLAGTAELIGR